MEIPTSVRDLVRDFREPFSPEEEARLTRLQHAHDRFLVLMEGFQEQATGTDSNNVSPDVRMKYHELRIQMFQDWRTKVMEYFFGSSPSSNDEEDALNSLLEKCAQTCRSERAPVQEFLGHFMGDERETGDTSTREDLKKPVPPIDSFNVRGVGSLADALILAQRLVPLTKEANSLFHTVLGRFEAAKEAVKSDEEVSELVNALESFILILSSYSRFSLACRVVQYAKIDLQLWRVHEALDRISCNGKTAWIEQLDDELQHHGRALKEIVQDSSALRREIEGVRAFREAVVVLRHELARRGTTQPNHLAKEMLGALMRMEISPELRVYATQPLPKGFISPADVVFDVKPFAKGSFGSVYHGRLDSGRKVVVKVIDLGDRRGCFELESFIHEIGYLTTLVHPYVNRVLGASHLTSPAFIVYEGEMNGNLSEYLKRESDAGRSKIHRLLYQAALGLHYLHSKGITHGNLKIQNILVSEEGYARISDFGLRVVKESLGAAMARIENSSAADVDGLVACVRTLIPNAMSASNELQHVVRNNADDLPVQTIGGVDSSRTPTETTRTLWRWAEESTKTRDVLNILRLHAEAEEEEDSKRQLCTRCENGQDRCFYCSVALMNSLRGIRMPSSKDLPDAVWLLTISSDLTKICIIKTLTNYLDINSAHQDQIRETGAFSIIISLMRTLCALFAVDKTFQMRPVRALRIHLNVLLHAALFFIKVTESVAVFDRTTSRIECGSCIRINELYELLDIIKLRDALSSLAIATSHGSGIVELHFILSHLIATISTLARSHGSESKFMHYTSEGYLSACKKGLMFRVEFTRSLQWGLVETTWQAILKEAIEREDSALVNHILWNLSSDGTCVNATLAPVEKANVADENKDTPLVWAVIVGSLAMCELLVFAGARVNIYNQDGQSPLHCSTRLTNPAVMSFLLENGAKLNGPNGNDSPLHGACHQLNAVAVNLLLRSGADVTSRNKDGYTPLAILVSRSVELEDDHDDASDLLKCTHLLLSQGAEWDSSCQALVKRKGSVDDIPITEANTKNSLTRACIRFAECVQSWSRLQKVWSTSAIPEVPSDLSQHGLRDATMYLRNLSESVVPDTADVQKFCLVGGRLCKEGISGFVCSE